MRTPEEILEHLKKCVDVSTSEYDEFSDGFDDAFAEGYAMPDGGHSRSVRVSDAIFVWFRKKLEAIINDSR